MKKGIAGFAKFFWVVILLLVCGTHAVLAKAYLVPVKGDIDYGVAGFVDRSIKDAIRNRAEMIIFEIDSMGGLVDAGLSIRDSVINTDIPTITFVSGRAWSAAALIALSGDDLYMVKSSSIGSAETIPKEEKTISAVRREFKATAEALGRDGIIAEAMVDSDVEIPGLSPVGKILNLTASEAVNYAIADGIVDSLGDLLARKNLLSSDLIVKNPSGAERFARILTDPIISSFLLTVGFLGIILEFFTAGWGSAGTVGIVSLALFFGGRYLTGLAGLENIVLFLAGLILLMLEIFVIPGFGIIGILGIASLFTSIMLSFASYTQAVWVLIAAISFTALALKLLWKKLKGTPILKRIILDATLDDQKGYIAAPEGFKEIEGEMGVTKTVMRPSGLIEIEGKKYSAQTNGDFLEEGIKVRVVEVWGNRIIVEKVAE